MPIGINKDTSESRTLTIRYTFQTSKMKKSIGCRVSTNIGHTVYFTKHTGHLECVILEFFSLSEHNKTTKLHSQCRKIDEKAFLNVRAFCKKKQ